MIKKRKLSLPQLAMFGGTRAAFGAGAALLLADRMRPRRRRAVGRALLALGAISTVPLVAIMVRNAKTA